MFVKRLFRTSAWCEQVWSPRTMALGALVLFVMVACPSWADRPGSGGCIVFDTVINAVPNLVSDAGIANSITQKLTNAEGAYMAGDINASVGILMALGQEIMAQTGKGIDEQSAAMLQDDVQDLIAYVTNPDDQ